MNDNDIIKNVNITGKFDQAKFNSYFSTSIEQVKKIREEKELESLNKINERNKKLDEIKNKNYLFTDFILNLILNLPIILIDILFLNFEELFINEKKLLFLGIWIIIFGLIMYFSLELFFQ